MKDHSKGAIHASEAVTSVPDALSDVIQQAREWVRETGADMAALVIDGKLSAGQMSAGLEEVRAFIQDAGDLSARWAEISGRLTDSTVGYVAESTPSVAAVQESPVEETSAPGKKARAPKASAVSAAAPVKEKDRFDPAICKALRILGGSGSSAQVKEAIEDNGLIEFGDGDFEVYGNGKTAWRLAVDRGLTSLRHDGQVEKDENKVWSLI